MKTYGDNCNGISISTFDQGELGSGSVISALLAVRAGAVSMQAHYRNPVEIGKLRSDLEAIVAGIVEAFYPEELEGYVAPSDEPDDEELRHESKADYDCWLAESVE